MDIALTDGTVATPPGTYTTRTLIERRFGAQNVAKWADVNCDGVAATIAEVIAAVIAAVSARIDDRLRESQLSFRLPVATEANETPKTLEFVATDMVGYFLSNSRGTTDYDEKGRPISRLRGVYQEALNTLELIALGTLKLEDAP